MRSESRARSPADTLNPVQLAERAAHLALEKKAHDIVILDLRNISTVADFFVIASAGADDQEFHGRD